jgi:hypothetical protein
MTPIVDITGARRAIRGFLVHADGVLPADTFAKLEDLADSPSPVDQIARTAELLYARRDELDDEGRTLVGQLASFAATNGWHGMADANRGGLIAQAMRRDMGLVVEPGQPKPQPVAEDPTPAQEFVKPEEVAPAAPIAPVTPAAGE